MRCAKFFSWYYIFNKGDVGSRETLNVTFENLRRSNFILWVSGVYYFCSNLSISVDPLKLTSLLWGHFTHWQTLKFLTWGKGQCSLLSVFFKMCFMWNLVPNMNYSYPTQSRRNRTCPLWSTYGQFIVEFMSMINSEVNAVPRVQFWR